MACNQCRRSADQEFWNWAVCGSTRNVGIENSKFKIQKSKYIEDEYETFELNEEDKPYNIRHRCNFFSKEVIGFVNEVEYERIFSTLLE